MKIFLTGATGFIGTELVKQLIAANHQVRGLARSDAGVAQLKAAGAEPLHGDLTDLALLRQGATGMDAAVHLAFNHDDMTRFAESARNEVAAIEALASGLEPGKLLVVTSGVALVAGKPGEPFCETDLPVDSQAIPRRPEQTAQSATARGVHVAIVRLPQVHDTRKQGLVTWLIQTARDKGFSAYVGDGATRWSAAPLDDVARLYKLAIEQSGPGVTTLNAVQEEGVSVRAIAETIGKGLNLPVRSLPPEAAIDHFGPFIGHLITRDMPATSTITRTTFDWNPTGPSLLEDLANMTY